MKKFSKKVKKGAVALLAVVMVMGVSPVGVLAANTIFPTVSISNTIRQAPAVLDQDTSTEIEKAFLNQVNNNDWMIVSGSLNSFNSVRVSAPATLTITEAGDSFGYTDYLVQSFKVGGGELSINTNTYFENGVEGRQVLAVGNSFAMPADAQLGDILAIAFYNEITGGAWAHIIEIAEREISVTVNGMAVNFADQQPAIVGGRTLVPVRGVFESLGFVVSWNSELRQATLANANDTIVITMGSETFTTNNVNHALDVAAQNIGGRTMIPLRAVLESVGYSLDWDGATRTVIVTAPTPTSTPTSTSTNQSSGILLSTDMPVPLEGDPTVDELIDQMNFRGLMYDNLVDGRPAFMLTNVEVDSFAYTLPVYDARFAFFGTLGYIRNIDERPVFLVYNLE